MANDKYEDVVEEREFSGFDDEGAADDFANMPTAMDDDDVCAKINKPKVENADVNQFSDSDDMDDEDLLVTSEIKYKATIQETEDAPLTVGGEINNRSVEFRDDASFSDEDLLTD